MMSDAIACSAGRNINFLVLLMLIQVCIPTRERGNEENTPRHARKTLPVIPAKHSPSFPRRRESIKEQPILNELTRRGLCMHSHAEAWERGKNKAPTSGAVISAHPCCSCYFPGQAILGSQAVPDLRIYPGIGTELLPFNLVKTFCMPTVAIRLISWR